MKEDVATDLRDIKRKIREYYKQYYDNKFNNLDDINKYLANLNYQN